MLIAQGLDPVKVATQMGHDNPGFTLSRYSHLFDAATSHEAIRSALQAAMLGKSLASRAGEGRGEDVVEPRAEVVNLQDFED